MASPAFASRRSRTWARWDLDRGTRLAGGGLAWSPPAVRPQCGQSQVSGTSAVNANQGEVRWWWAHQKETRFWGWDGPRPGSPAGPAPGRLPRSGLRPVTASASRVRNACLRAPRPGGPTEGCGRVHRRTAAGDKVAAQMHLRAEPWAFVAAQ